MKKYLFLFLLITLGYPFVLHAQFDPKPQIQKPSAEAQSLGKFGEIPVDLYTGRVNIDIPIYTVKYYDIDVPVSISYHGGGIKVSDESGSVGLGWTLNVGGVINRIVRGMPDNLYDNSNKVAGFENLWRLTLANTLNQFTDFINLIKRRPFDHDPMTLLDARSGADLHVADMISKYGEEYDNGHFDTAPDNYSFNVQGLSGAFVHNSSNMSGVTLQSNDGVSIATGPAGYSYSITDADGYKYDFQDTELQTYFYKVGYGWYMTDYDTRPEHCFKYPSSYWLSRITSLTGTEVNFSYTDAKIAYPKAPVYGYTQRLKLTQGGSITPEHLEMIDSSSYVIRPESYEFIYPLLVDDCHFFNTVEKRDTTYKKLLNRIETPACIVRFYYDKPVSQSFFNSSPRLDSITVCAFPDTTRVIEKTKFLYGAGVAARTQLLQLVKQGADGETQTYRFNYIQSSAVPPVSVNDNRQDHWGYFSPSSNGRFSNKIYFGITPQELPSSIYTDRYADNTVADNNMLSKITYPAGGSSEFTWEPHSYSDLSYAGQAAPQDRVSQDEIVYAEPTFEIEKTLSLCGKLNHQLLTASHYIGGQKTIILDFSSYYPNAENCYSCLYGWNDGNNFTTTTDMGDRTHLVIKKNGTVWKLVHICAQTVQNPVKLTAEAGTYTFELKNPRESFQLHCGGSGAEIQMWYDIFNMYGADTSQYGYVNVQFGDLQTFSSSGFNYKNVGGVRIKRITNKTNEGTALIKEYKYVKDLSDPQSPSSGVLSYPPRYGSKMQHYESVCLPMASGSFADIRNHPEVLTLRSNGLPYILNGGSHIEYSKVTESVVQMLDGISRKPIRQTEYTFQTGIASENSDVDDTKYGIFVPSDMLQLTSQNYRRGHLKQKVEYTDERKVSVYQYEILEQGTADTITGSPFTIGDYSYPMNCRRSFYSNNVVPYKDMGIVKYRVIPYNKRLQSVTTEGSKANNYQAYTYSNNTYSGARAANAPLSHSTIDSEGDTITQYFTYVNANLNRVRTCVTVKKGKIIDAYRNEYDTQGRIIEKYIALLNPAGLPAANNYNAVSLTSEKIESYLYYNNRLVQLTDHRSGISTVYLWSYKGTYPVAEIQNATFSNISSLLGSNTVNNLFHTYTPDMSLLNGLRNSIPGARVSTMTYRLLRGITSFTDPKGTTTYFDYNGFGQLKECYIQENGQKKIVQKMEYHWSH
ncbi:hypothetical protein FACS1894182_10130 [Bacteroidia bacterium]|nr:hypothetical protein FACS1894182_10130 [Bacteroidia bacterium]